MRVFTKTRALVLGTAALGAGLLAVAALEGRTAPLAVLALLGAGVVLTELIQVSGDEHAPDPLDAQIFSFSSGVHVAAVLLLGPWAGALVAAFGILVVDGIRGSPLRHLAFNASVLALAAVAGGYAFQLVGGVPGALDLPGDFQGIVTLATVYYALNTSLVSAVVALQSCVSILPLTRDAFRAGLPSAAGEAGLGVALALFAQHEPWSIVALVPLVVAVYQSYARLATLRRETARALETFANVVDERDPSTYQHSARVAEYVREFAQALGLPSAEVARLRWAGRLHDLGKIAVDAAVLGKPGGLDSEEWAAVRRHPRVSARLLRRFRFAAMEARAVEYHHERVDGTGYYGIEPREIPVAAHFLSVADSYDAMTSERPYHTARSRERALAEIEARIGSQFHPAVAKAFVALQRGQDPHHVLSSAERAQLRRAFGRSVRLEALLVPPALRKPEVLAVIGLVAGLFAVGAGAFEVAPLGGALASGALAWRRVQHFRAHRLVSSLREAIAASPDRGVVFDGVVGRLARSSHVHWAGLVAWQEQDLAGAVELEWSDGSERPTETALTSWLIREAEAAGGPLLATGAELGRRGLHLALPLRRAGSLAGYLVVSFARTLPRHVELGLTGCAEDLALQLIETAEPASPRRLKSAAVA